MCCVCAASRLPQRFAWRFCTSFSIDSATRREREDLLGGKTDDSIRRKQAYNTRPRGQAVHANMLFPGTISELVILVAKRKSAMKVWWEEQKRKRPSAEIIQRQPLSGKKQQQKTFGRLNKSGRRGPTRNARIPTLGNKTTQSTFRARYVYIPVLQSVID